MDARFDFIFPNSERGRALGAPDAAHLPARGAFLGRMGYWMVQSVDQSRFADAEKRGTVNGRPILRRP